MQSIAPKPVQRRSVGGLHLVTKDAWLPEELRQRIDAFDPRSQLGRIIKTCFQFLPAEQAAELLDRISSTLVIESKLDILTRTYDERTGLMLVRDYGEVSHKVITTAGVGFLVDAWQNIVELEIMKYHGIGTSNAAEAVGNTGLTAESTTALNPASTRGTGTTEEGVSGNIFKTIGTLVCASTIVVEEHGIFSVATVNTGVLWDRSLTGTTTLTTAGDSITATYLMTASAGG